MKCDIALKLLISERLQNFAVRPLVDPGSTRAAVAVVVTDASQPADVRGIDDAVADPEHATLLLTRRSARLRAHPGQWALPGGRLDAGENPLQAALRELDEEVGVRLPPAALLGYLDDFKTRSGYVITPVVVWGGSALECRINVHEVASVHRIPLREFQRDDAPVLTPLEGSEQPVLRMPIGLDHIAAPTAALLYQFREVCLRNTPTRVAHFEQPRFAWK